MRLLTIISSVLFFGLLTILTQIGGIVYLLSFITRKWTDPKAKSRVWKMTWRTISFLALYFLTSLLAVPPIAKVFGRVPLSWTADGQLQPLNKLTCVLNRHYVKPELKQIASEVAGQMNDKFPGTTLSYLDAGFPFFDKFPLFPHLSHHDGKKLDLSFCYVDNRTGKPTNENPSWIGYGAYEKPRPSETGMADYCLRKGYWQYNLLAKINPLDNKANLTFDDNRTRELFRLFASHAGIGRIFVEPYLKERLGLKSDKIRFQGCHSVRHDDHVHVQLR